MSSSIVYQFILVWWTIPDPPAAPSPIAVVHHELLQLPNAPQRHPAAFGVNPDQQGYAGGEKRKGGGGARPARAQASKGGRRREEAESGVGLERRLLWLGFFSPTEGPYCPLAWPVLLRNGYARATSCTNHTLFSVQCAEQNGDTNSRTWVCILQYIKKIKRVVQTKKIDIHGSQKEDIHAKSHFES
jgi:hypothetical protein